MEIQKAIMKLNSTNDKVVIKAKSIYADGHEFISGFVYGIHNSYVIITDDGGELSNVTYGRIISIK